LLSLYARYTSKYDQYIESIHPTIYTEVININRPAKIYVLFQLSLSAMQPAKIVPDPAKPTFNTAHTIAIIPFSRGTSVIKPQSSESA